MQPPAPPLPSPHSRLGVCADFFRCVQLRPLVSDPGRQPVAGAAPPRYEGDRLVIDTQAAGMSIVHSEPQAPTEAGAE